MIMAISRDVKRMHFQQQREWGVSATEFTQLYITSVSLRMISVFRDQTDATVTSSRNGVGLGLLVAVTA